MENSLPKVHSSPNDENGPEPSDRFLPARKFFSSRRAPKTLDLAVIKAITACSQSSQLSARDIVESLKLSREIVEAFDTKEKVRTFRAGLLLVIGAQIGATPQVLGREESFLSSRIFLFIGQNPNRLSYFRHLIPKRATLTLEQNLSA